MTVRKMIVPWLAVLGAIAQSAAHAVVSEASASGFVSTHEMQLAAAPRAVYRALTRDIHRWWDASHSYGGDARAFSLRPRPGGCFCERLADGGFVEHMRVVFAQPNKELRLAGGLGPLQTMAVSGSMVFALQANANGTRLNYSYRVTGAGLDGWADPVDRVQLGQLQRLQNYLDRGDPLAAAGRDSE